MNKRFLTLLVIAALTAGYTNAQVTFGARAGVGFTDLMIKNKELDMTVNTSLRPGFQIGALAEISIGKDSPMLNERESMAFLTGLLIASQGSEWEAMGMKQTVKLTYLQVPANIMARMNLSRMTFWAQVGPYLGFAVGGKNTVEIRGTKSEDKIKFGSGDDAYMKGFDLGVNVAFGLQFGNIQVGLGGNGGLLNLSNEKEMKMQNFGLSLNATYLFGK